MTPDRFIAAAFREWSDRKKGSGLPEDDIIYSIEQRAAELARESVGDGDELDEVLHQLDSWCKAYPEDLFPEPADADLKWLHETRRGLCDRVSASMGRHMVRHMRQMAETIRKDTAWNTRAAGDKE